MRTLRLALRQVGYENRAFWRNPVAAFFTCFFPLMFLVIFNLLFGNERLEVRGGTVNQSTFYVPAITSLSVISACYTNIAIGVTFARDRGFLKRLQGTPLPPAAYIAGRIGHATLVALLLVAIVSTFGAAFYGVDLPTRTLPAFLVTLAVGAAAFCSLGLAVTSVVPNADAAPAVINASILPLMFISDVFVRLSDAPRWLTDASSVFPIIHFSRALQTAFNPFESGAGFEPRHLAVLAAWGVAGILLSARFFSWEARK